jgi:hypothetical protein
LPRLFNGPFYAAHPFAAVCACLRSKIGTASAHLNTLVATGKKTQLAVVANMIHPAITVQTVRDKQIAPVPKVQTFDCKVCGGFCRSDFILSRNCILAAIGLVGMVNNAGIDILFNLQDTTQKIVLLTCTFSKIIPFLLCFCCQI